MKRSTPVLELTIPEPRKALDRGSHGADAIIPADVGMLSEAEIDRLRHLKKRAAALPMDAFSKRED